MKRLIVMRHAKSDWSGRAQSDHDRPLNARGRRSAAALGQWLRAHHYVPDQVLCSSAERTGETCLRLSLDPATPVEFTRALYLAAPDAILEAVRKATGDTVLVIGHNPGIANFAAAVLQEAPLQDGFTTYPTGATLVATCDVNEWSEVGWSMAKAEDFVLPRALF